MLAGWLKALINQYDSEIHTLNLVKINFYVIKRNEKAIDR